MGKSQQKKGRGGELELVRLLTEKGYNSVQAGRALSYGSQPDIIGLEGVHVEVKRCEALRLSEWMKQAIRDSEKFQDGEPAVFHRRNREGWLVTMPLESWLRIYDQNCKQTD